MKLSRWTMICVVTSASMLAGCVPPPTKVRNVLADKTGYLAANFAPDTIKQTVRDKIQAADATPLVFQKMKIGLTWTFDRDDKNKTSTGQKTTTYTNAGGNLVNMLSEYSKNGITFKQEYDLAYRGLVMLKTQYTNDSSTFATPQYEVKEFEQFDSVHDAHEAQQLAYKFKYGGKVQIMNFRDGSVACTVGKTYPASKESAALAGDAQDIDCTTYNNNGVEQGKSGYVYLKKYGVAILSSTKSVTGVSDAKIDSVEIE